MATVHVVCAREKRLLCHETCLAILLALHIIHDGRRRAYLPNTASCPFSVKPFEVTAFPSLHNVLLTGLLRKNLTKFMIITPCSQQKYNSRLTEVGVT
ncbi:hypothetical protein Y032_0249g110 [Ancylostoma ceylanicum]|uniref:Uncharacterized protein n=1 Tax=Ancylostoma ceylanicum TaxID=53326 RepID=A0A016SCC5_9BILA|nr:hypothetical protein Y032_0249g110 [Ancylostoma ceylanicum]